MAKIFNEIGMNVFHMIFHRFTNYVKTSLPGI